MCLSHDWQTQIVIFLSIKHWAEMLYYSCWSAGWYRTNLWATVSSEGVTVGSSACLQLAAGTALGCAPAASHMLCYLLRVSLIYSYCDSTCITQRNNNQLLQWHAEHLAWNILVQGRASVCIRLLLKTALNIRNKKIALVLLPTYSAFSPHRWWRRARIRGPFHCARNWAYNRHRGRAVTE